VKISKLIELLTPYAEFEAIAQMWDYNQQEDVRHKVLGIQVILTEEGATDFAIVLEIK